MNDFWTDEKLAELTRLCELGHSYGQIGKALGCTRCAAIGKARRKGLADRRTAADPRTFPARRVYVRPKSDRPLAQRHPRIAPDKPLPEPKPISVADASFARPWLERRGAQCAYPIQGTGADVWSCCAATGDVAVTYCATHRAAMFRKAPSKAQIAAAQRLRDFNGRLMKSSQRARAA